MINEDNFCRMQCTKPLSFGIAAGIVVGAFMLLLGFVAGTFGKGIELVNALASFYIGYGTGIVGLLIGFGWGFAEGFVCGYMIIWICMKINGNCRKINI